MKKWIEYLKNNDYTVTPGRYWKAYKDFCICGLNFRAKIYDGGYRIELEDQEMKIILTHHLISMLETEMQNLKIDSNAAMLLKEVEEEGEQDEQTN